MKDSHTQFSMRLLLAVFALPSCLVLGGCGNASVAQAKLQSSNQMKELWLGITNYQAVNGTWPDRLEDVSPFVENRLDEFLKNPVTDDKVGYEYVKPTENADPATTIVLYQLRDGNRASDLRVLYADGHLSDISSTPN